MADREFILEILLKARDETARAIATALGELEAYNKALEEQRTKSAAQVKINQDLARSHREVSQLQGAVARGNRDVLNAQANYEKAVQRSVKAERDLRSGHAQTAKEAVESRQNLEDAGKKLISAINDADKSDDKFNRASSLRASQRYRNEVKNREVLSEQSKLFDELNRKVEQLGRTTDPGQVGKLENEVRNLGTSIENLGGKTSHVRQGIRDAFDTSRMERAKLVTQQNSREMEKYRSLVDNVARAERRRDDILNRAQRFRPAERAALKERLDVDVGAARARLEEFRLAERVHPISLSVKVQESDIAKARLELDALGASGGRGPTGFLGGLEKALGKADEDLGGFVSKFRSAFGFALVVLVQPVAAAIVGLSGAFLALASAAVGAAAAVGTTFISAIVQGIPVMGIFIAAMQRLGAVFSYVSALHQQQQQAFLTAYQNAQQNALGVNQVTEAQRSYQNSLFGVTEAERGYNQALFNVNRAQQDVKLAQQQLTITRRDAARQIQDLVFQEQQAKLAAEESSLAIIDAQKGLRQAVATGGDVARAQLGLREAQLNHQQAVVQVSRASEDAQRALSQGVAGNPQVIAAQRAVVDAKRSLNDAQFEVVRARRAISEAQHQVVLTRAQVRQAQMAAAGYNAATAAQLAFMRSQMSATERALAVQVQKIFGLFYGTNSRIRQLTDQILGAFIPVAARIYQIITDPKLFGAFRHLASEMAAGIRIFFNTVLSPQAVRGFIVLTNAAAANMRPLARLAANFFKSIGLLVQAASPALHSFIGFLVNLSNRFLRLIQSARGQNWLKRFFDDAFHSLEAFINLGASLGRLIGDVISVGGGARAGIGLIDTLRHKIDSLSASIEGHGKAFRTLHTLWNQARPTLHSLGIIIGALVSAIFRIGTSKGSQEALRNLATILSRYVIPAVIQAAKYIGGVTNELLHFLAQHPRLARFLEIFLGASIAVAALTKGIRLLFGPAAAIVGIFTKITGLLRHIPGIGRIFGVFNRGGAIERALQAGGEHIKRLIGIGGENAGNTIAERIKGALGGLRTRGATPENAVWVRVAGQPIKVFVVDQAPGGGRRGRGGKDEPPPRGKSPREGEPHPTTDPHRTTEPHPTPHEPHPTGGVATEAAASASAARRLANRIPFAEKALDAIGKVGSKLGPAVAAVVGVGTAVASIVGGGGIFKGIGQGIQSLDLTTLIPGFSQGITGTIAKALGITGRVHDVTRQTSLSSLFGTAPQPSSDSLQALAVARDRGRRAPQGFTHALTSAFGGAGRDAERAGRGAGGGFLQGFGRTVSRIPHTVNTAINKVDPRHARPPGRKSGGGFLGGIGSIVSGIPGLVHGWINRINPRRAIPPGQHTGKGFSGGISSIVSGIPGFIGAVVAKFGNPNNVRHANDAGKKVAQGFANALSSAFDKISGAIADVFAKVSGQAGKGANFLSNLFGGRQYGGPVPGYGGGDRHGYMLESGEHVLTKEEVRAAGGHGAIFAMRRALGGGRQGGPHGYQAGGGILPHVGRGGTFVDVANVSVDTPGFTQREIGVYNRAQAVISSRIRHNAVNLVSGIKQFLSNYQLVGGDNGIFALAAQAVDDYIQQQQSVVQLAAAGVRLLGERLKFGRPQTALQAAQIDVRATQRGIRQLENLQRAELTAFRAINAQIRALGTPTAATLPLYQRLIGAREEMIKRLHDADQKLGQALSDLYQKQVALFEEQTNKALRGTTTLRGFQIGAVLGTAGRGAFRADFANLGRILARVGPQIANGIAQMAQQIAQTLADPNKLIQADQAVLSSAQDIQRVIYNRYREAARRAQRDPRWRTVADQLLEQLEQATQTVVQAQAQALQDRIQAASAAAQRRITALDIRNRLSQVQAGLGDQSGAIATQVAVSQQREQTLRDQVRQYQGLLAQAQAQGNIGVVNDLTDQIKDLNAQIKEANLQTQQLITSQRQLAISILQTQSQAQSGFFQAANQISQTLGNIAGSQNLPALISYAKEAGQALLNQAQQITKNIRDTINSSAFGSFQGEANRFLAELNAAFQKGPQAFANELAAISPQLAAFEALLPPDMQTLFQGLVQAMVDNTTSTVDNTQQLQQLNATTNQQQFQSSAWQMFREAIFNGLGGLLPQYAMQVPSADIGAHISRSGLLYGHTGETVVPASVSRFERSSVEKKNENHFHIDHPMEVADPVHFGNQVAWRLSHDPNAR